MRSAFGEPLLPLSLMNRERFLGLFYDPVKFDIQTKTAMYLHVLRVDGGDFTLAPLYNELANNSVTYVLSRQNMDKVLTDPSRMMEFADKVKAQFKTPDPNAGEGGELLLYSFLEGHLGAPKILSKMELKTSAEHYVHGTDGVHLLKIGEDEYQLIFGESKMYGDVTGQVGSSIKRAIKAAFSSMGKVQEDAFEFDTWLVESELLKESLDEEKVALLASILFPLAQGPSPIQKSNAFGVFIGYELDVTSFPFADLTPTEIEGQLRKLAKDVIAAEVGSIQKEVTDRGLGGYHFHMYAVPFLKQSVNGKVRGIEDVRLNLAARLSGKEAKK
ncbi:DUF1837 domain-containing protein [Ferrimicrobium sp.]|jgi:hypothetical protein|uniref:HamA C-terminal domain-containing protein n=1 Tax=Ferrimicrobium sp. TaxID=2926050 RepID=UPI0026136172|nr:DUF1837 domain-containing protein [Ferrimicrobium sp.]